MTSKAHTFRKSKKTTPSVRQTLPKKKLSKQKPHINTDDDDSISDNNSSGDTFEFGLSGGDTDDTDITASTDISQEFSDEEALMKYYETKVRGKSFPENASDESTEESELPPRLKEMMDNFRKQNSQSQPNRKDIHGNLSTKDTTNNPLPRSHSSRNKMEGCKDGSIKKVSKHGQTVAGHNKCMAIGKRRVSKADQRVPPKEEAAFQKSVSYGSLSAYSKFSSDDIMAHYDPRKAKEHIVKKVEPILKGAAKTALTGFHEISFIMEQRKVFTANRKERRDKIISYLGQIDDVETGLYSQSKGKLDTESSDVDPSTARAALLRKYGFEMTSDDELLKLDGAANRRRRREKRRILFPKTSSSSSSSGSDDGSLNGEEMETLLRAFLGRAADDIDVDEIVRHGRKWRNCFEDGECDCRPRNEREIKRKKEDQEKKVKQFLDIFDGKDPEYDDYTREDLLKAHEKIGPWIHAKTKKLDQFIESGKYSPRYLLNIWDGRLSDDSSDDPDFEKYRQEYDKKVAAAAEEGGTPIPPEDRVPTLEENNWYLFPTPLTRVEGKTQTESEQKINSRATMEVIANDLKRHREIEKAKEFLERRPFPEPHLYPRPTDLLKNEPEDQHRNQLFDLFRPSTAEKQ